MKKVLTVCLMLLVSGCASINNSQFAHNAPNRGSVKQTADTASVGASPNAPVLLRIIKETKELELWKQNKDKSWDRIKTYNICAVSGTLGPKIKQGDYQAPEGFYSITRNQLNPNSSEHLSFNTGYPNLRDAIDKHTGSALMVHGGCSSAGCYAITDPSIEEVYAAVRDALYNGQDAVQLQIYPYRMNTWNMFVMRDNPNYKFWQELKAGWDWFETHRTPIPVTVKNGKYQIN